MRLTHLHVFTESGLETFLTRIQARDHLWDVISAIERSVCTCTIRGMQERLEATGPRGEACIVVRTVDDIDTSNLSGRSDRPGLASYRLATGERLNPTDDPKVFETLDGLRQFKLR